MAEKLLIIDNTSPLIHTWKKGLEAEFEVAEAMGGVEAVRKIKNEGIRLVIANISLRHINGVEAVSKIRSTFDRLPIIVLHEARDLLDLKQAKAYNIDAAMSLPVDYRKLTSEIKRLLGSGGAPANNGYGPPASSASTVNGARHGGESALARDLNVEERFYEGLSAISANNIPEAIGIFESLLAITRLKHETWRRYLDEALFQLGQCHAAQGDLEKSNSYYKTFIAKAPHNTSFKSALLYLGKNYLVLKDHAKAAAYLKQVINTPPFDSFGTQARKLLKTIEPAK